MKYGLWWAAPARNGLADLPPMLQEETLDEIESLVDDPTRLVFRGAARIAIHDFVRFYAGQKYTVFIKVQRERVQSLETSHNRSCQNNRAASGRSQAVI
jgi:hypothetical protein